MMLIHQISGFGEGGGIQDEMKNKQTMKIIIKIYKRKDSRRELKN